MESLDAGGARPPFREGGAMKCACGPQPWSPVRFLKHGGEWAYCNVCLGCGAVTPLPPVRVWVPSEQTEDAFADYPGLLAYLKSREVC